MHPHSSHKIYYSQRSRHVVFNFIQGVFVVAEPFWLAAETDTVGEGGTVEERWYGNDLLFGDEFFATLMFSGEFPRVFEVSSLAAEESMFVYI